MYSDKIKINEKPSRHKVRHGDVIIRSEYNDGVLRDNSRANNRLNSQMKLFEKAERIILKDLGKETRFIRSRMNSTTITSPRLSNYSSPNKHVASYSVYGKSTYSIQGKQNDPQTEKNKVPVYQSLSNKSVYTLAKECKQKTERRPRREGPIATKKSNSLSGDIKPNCSTFPLTVSTTTPRMDPTSDFGKSKSTPRNERKTHTIMSNSYSTDRTSAAFRKRGIQSSVGDRQISPASQLSFMEILQKADEVRAKGLTVEEYVPRPKTPEHLSDYGSYESEKEQKRTTQVGSTPKSTLISYHN